MKRLISFILICALIMSFAVPCLAASTDTENTASEIHLEYMEFYNNQEYYKNLAKNEGYTLIISVGKEYEAIEEQRINESISQNDNFQRSSDSSISARGVEVPTSKYNISIWGKYSINGRSVQSTLYTEKKVYGVTDYEISLHNRYDADSDLSFKVITHGFYKTGDDYFYVQPGKTVLKYYQTREKSDTAYLEFKAPVSVEGYIQEGT